MHILFRSALHSLNSQKAGDGKIRHTRVHERIRSEDGPEDDSQAIRFNYRDYVDILPPKHREALENEIFKSALEDLFICAMRNRMPNCKRKLWNASSA